MTPEEMIIKEGNCMHRNETFHQSTLTIAVHLAWANLDVCTAEIEEIQVVVSGTDHEVQELRIRDEEGKLLVEQPAYGLTYKLNNERWMNVLLRLPTRWRGSLEACTISAPLHVRGVHGTDLTCDTVSGDMMVSDLTAIDLKMRTVSGSIRGAGIICEKLSVRTVSGAAEVMDCTFRQGRAVTVSGPVTIQTPEGFQNFSSTAVSGTMTLHAPLDAADFTLKSVSGRPFTEGVSLRPDAPTIRTSSVSGNVHLISHLEREKGAGGDR